MHNTAAGTDHFAAVSTNAFSFTSASLRLAVLLFFFSFFFFLKVCCQLTSQLKSFGKLNTFILPPEQGQEHLENSRPLP